jgi:hypothetical protein
MFYREAKHQWIGDYREMKHVFSSQLAGIVEENAEGTLVDKVLKHNNSGC